MGPEAKFYQQIKRNLKEFSFIRLENSSLLGTPDLLVCNTSGHFCTLELNLDLSNQELANYLRTKTYLLNPDLKEAPPYGLDI